MLIFISVKNMWSGGFKLIMIEAPQSKGWMIGVCVYFEFYGLSLIIGYLGAWRGILRIFGSYLVTMFLHELQF